MLNDDNGCLGTEKRRKQSVKMIIGIKHSIAEDSPQKKKLSKNGRYVALKKKR